MNSRIIYTTQLKVRLIKMAQLQIPTDKPTLTGAHLAALVGDVNRVCAVEWWAIHRSALHQSGLDRKSKKAAEQHYWY